MSYAIVFVTAEDTEEAGRIASGLLRKKLAACCNIVKDVRSLYWWQGKMEDVSEALLVIKTRQELFKELVAEVKALHSYSIPEVVMLPITEGNDDYLRWIDDSTK